VVSGDLELRRGAEEVLMLGWSCSLVQVPSWGCQGSQLSPFLTLASGVGECRGRLGGWRTLANPSVFTTSSVPLPARGQWGRTHQWLLDCNEVSRKEQMLSGRESRDDKVSEQA
jgi:hypothetical protein